MKKPKNLVLSLLESYVEEFATGLPEKNRAREKVGINTLIRYLKESAPNRLVSETEELEIDLVNWRDSFFESSLLTMNTRRDYFLSGQRYIKFLIRTKKIYPLKLARFVSKVSNHREAIAKSYDKPVDRIEKDKVEESDYRFKCTTNILGEETTVQDLGILMQLDRGSAIARHFRSSQNGYARSTQYRRLSVFKNFLQHLKGKGLLETLDSLNQEKYQLVTYEYYYEKLTNNKKSLATFNSGWSSLTQVLVSLSRAGVFPEFHIQPPLKNGWKASKLLKRNYKLLSISLRSTIRCDDDGKTIRNAYDLAEKPNEDFLIALERDESYVFNLIRNAAILEARKAINEFQLGQEEISKCDIKDLRSTFDDTRELVDLNYHSEANRSYLSYFSTKHPSGLSNLLGYIWHENNGLAFNNAFPGARRIYEHGAQNVKDMLGLNPKNALPFFLIILGETGLNVGSLENAKIEDSNGKKILLVPTDADELVRVDLQKPRARKTISKLIRPSDKSSILHFDEDSEINAYICFKAVLEMTKQYRNANSTTDLWIGPYSVKKPHAANKISSSTFKNNFKKFLKRHPSLEKLDHRYITRANIRVTGGILEWFRSGGDLKATAKYLGNSPITALRNYVPKEIVEVLQRREIRRFQNMLIITSTNDSEELTYRALPNLTKSQVDKLASDYAESPFFRESQLGKTLFSEGTKDVKAANNSGRLTFISSNENVAILKLISNSIAEAELANPGALVLTELFEGRPLFKWRELWLAIKYTLSTSNDRGHRIMLTEGLELANQWGQESS